MGFKAIALDYVMDNGMADTSPKTALAWFSPEETKKQGDFLQPLSAQAGTEPLSDTTTPQDGGNGMTSFERESRGSAGNATPENQVPENQQTQAEKEMRDSARGIAQGDGQAPQQQQPQAPGDNKPFFGPQPNGDLRIGDDVYLRKKLPDWANVGISGLVGSQLPGGLLGEVYGGWKFGEYVDENFRWPWLTHEPQQGKENKGGAQ